MVFSKNFESRQSRSLRFKSPDRPAPRGLAPPIMDAIVSWFSAQRTTAREADALRRDQALYHHTAASFKCVRSGSASKARGA